MGGDGLDGLVGGSGRDVLIGGRGLDALVGGGGEDLLIAGWTDFDSDSAALLALSLEWISGGAYEQRVSSLTDTTGPRLAHSTVHDDGVPDA